MTAKQAFTFVEVTERPKQNSMAIKRQRLIEGLTKQSAEVARFAAGHWSPRMWFWADDSGKFYLGVRYAKKPLPISEGVSEPAIIFHIECNVEISFPSELPNLFQMQLSTLGSQQ